MEKLIEVKFKRHSKKISHIDELTHQEKEELLEIHTQQTALLEQFFASKEGDPMKIATQIIDMVTEELEVPYELLKGTTKPAEIVFARQLCMYLINMRTTLSLKKIGQLFNRDHTTVIASKRVINDMIDTNHESKKSILYFINKC